MSGGGRGTISFSLGGGGPGRGGRGSAGRGVQPAAGGKVAFGLGGRSGGAKRLATTAAAAFEAPESDDEDGEPARGALGGSAEKRQRVEGPGSLPSSRDPDPPSDPEVLKAADKLASFVAKNGENFEQVTKERNPGVTPFRFLFDKGCNDYRWYRKKLDEYRGGPATEGPNASARASRGEGPGGSIRDPDELDVVNTIRGAKVTTEAKLAKVALAQGDSLAAMNAFMRLAAKHEEKRGPVQDTRAMPPPDILLGDKGQEKTFAVYKEDGARGHHMGDYIPKEEMDRFLAKQGDPGAKARLAAQELAARIGSDNKGHQMMQKMGWTDGAGLGASQAGMSTPINAGEVKQDNLGIGAASTHEVSEADDIYEAYKKRMMLGYKFRPNPLGNPRKQYY